MPDVTVEVRYADIVVRVGARRWRLRWTPEVRVAFGGNRSTRTLYEWVEDAEALVDFCERFGEEEIV